MNIYSAVKTHTEIPDNYPSVFSHLSSVVKVIQMPPIAGINRKLKLPTTFRVQSEQLIRR